MVIYHLLHGATATVRTTERTGRGMGKKIMRGRGMGKKIMKGEGRENRSVTWIGGVGGE